MIQQTSKRRVQGRQIIFWLEVQRKQEKGYKNKVIIIRHFQKCRSGLLGDNKKGDRLYDIISQSIHSKQRKKVIQCSWKSFRGEKKRMLKRLKDIGWTTPPHPKNKNNNNKKAICYFLKVWSILKHKLFLIHHHSDFNTFWELG